MLPSKLISVVATAAAVVLFAGAAIAGAAVTNGPVSLLQSPQAGAPTISSVGRGTRIGVLTCDAETRWCLVNYHARQGYVSSDSLSFVRGLLAYGSVDDSGAGDGGAGTALGTPHLVLHAVPSGLLGGGTGLTLHAGSGVIKSLSGGSGGAVNIASQTRPPQK